MSGVQGRGFHSGAAHFSAAPVQRVRCAIYTRKSSEEGLEQDFNSLDAQREACAAYVLSQASEGWTLLPDIYDDGGISGGTLERPALQRLLGEVADGRIDIIVVYKVDRLTRSLLDFSKLVEAFDKAGTSFASVTQSFNTTTSMGRLTLNMLLSFAQFEREVTAERIRDKIAASKARGMWMGGTPPLGYQPDGRSLAIVEEHAAIIRDIFRRYLEVGNVRLVAEQLVRDGIGAPRRTRTTTSNTFGGVAFTRGQLYAILKCPTYIGEIHHKGAVHAALHPPIIEREVWDLTQAKLATRVVGQRSRGRAASASLLAGRIVDGDGAPLIATHATKGNTRYRYYVSHALHHKNSDTGMRIPAREIEALVIARTAALVEDPVELIATAWLDVPGSRYPELQQRGAGLAADLRLRRAEAMTIITQVRVTDAGIAVICNTAAIAAALGVAQHADAPATITLASEAKVTRSGRAMKLVSSSGAGSVAAVDPSLMKQLLIARRWWDELRRGEIDITRLAAREKVTSSYMTRIVRLAFLSPAVVDAILAGTQRTGVTARTLTLETTIPASWQQQRKLLLAAA